MKLTPDGPTITSADGLADPSLERALVLLWTVGVSGCSLSATAPGACELFSAPINNKIRNVLSLHRARAESKRATA
jgi:hypothetical protein